MTRLFPALVCAAIVLGAASASNAATLEVPADGTDASGIGYFSGWKCPPNNAITIVIDGGAPLAVPSGSRRGDTAAVCANDGRNGYIAQFQLQSAR